MQFIVIIGPGIPVMTTLMRRAVATAGDGGGLDNGGAKKEGGDVLMMDYSIPLA